MNKGFTPNFLSVPLPPQSAPVRCPHTVQRAAQRELRKLGRLTLQP